MRTVLLLTAVLLLACAASAQNSSSSQTSPAVAIPQLQVADNPQPPSREFKFRPFRQPRRAPLDEMGEGPCLTIRSYIFERQDGNAPRLVGMTTCTPSSQFKAKRAVAPQWGVYPATAAPAAPAVELKR